MRVSRTSTIRLAELKLSFVATPGQCGVVRVHGLQMLKVFLWIGRRVTTFLADVHLCASFLVRVVVRDVVHFATVRLQ